MNTNTNTKARGLKIKRTKRPAPPPSVDNKYGLNPALPFVEPAKDPDTNKETIRIKIIIDGTVSKEDKMNYETKSFKFIKTFGYNGAVVVETLRALGLDLFTPYLLNIPLPVENYISLFSRVLEGITKPQFREFVR